MLEKETFWNDLIHRFVSGALHTVCNELGQLRNDHYETVGAKNNPVHSVQNEAQNENLSLAFKLTFA